MKRRILALVLTLAMLLPCLMGEARAATSGSCGTNATWKFDADTGTLTISGTGKMSNYQFAQSAPWSNVSPNIRTVVIKKGITSIGSAAFGYCRNLVSVSIPSSVTSIGGDAFDSCISLTSIKIPSGVISIGDRAFNCCSSLKSLTIPASVTRIGEDVFWFCEELKSINVSSANKYYSSIDGVLFNKKQTTLLCFPANHSRTNYTIPESVITIGSCAFFSCRNIYKVTVPDSVVNIGDSVFSQSTLRKITMGNSVETIGDSAFCCCCLESISLPPSITNIGAAAFSVTPLLKSIIIPDSVTTIKKGTFSQCRNLTRVHIPKSVTNIADNAFLQCYSLTDVYYSGTQKQRQEIRIGVWNDDLEEATWHYNSVTAPKLSITGNTSTGKPKLTWQAVSGADAYRIYRAASQTGAYSYLKSTTSTSYTDSSAKEGNNYYYKIKAVDLDRDYVSGFSNRVNRVCDLCKPVLTASVNTSTGKPKLSWNKISGVEKYYIVRSTSKNGTYSKLATVTGTTYTDKTAKAGRKYYYKVKALHEKDAADSAYSSAVSRACDLAKPVVSITRKNGNPKLTWDKVSGADKYYVYRASSKDGTYKKVKTTVTVTSFTDTNVKAGRTYYYKVRAIHDNTSANSAYSAVKYITAK